MSSEQAVELHAPNSLNLTVDYFSDTRFKCNFTAQAFPDSLI
jgi:hypothetical protein